jgi:hypothetical protein
MDARAMVSFMYELDSTTVQKEFQEFSAPCIVLTGESDPLSAAADDYRGKENVRWQAVEGASHALQRTPRMPL